MKKPSDSDLIKQLQHRFEKSILEGDIDKYMDAFDDEAVTMEPNLPVLRGEKASVPGLGIMSLTNWIS